MEEKEKGEEQKEAEEEEVGGEEEGKEEEKEERLSRQCRYALVILALGRWQKQADS